MKDLTNGKLNEIRLFAKQTGQFTQFNETLNHLLRREKEDNVGNGGKESEVVLYPDFAPLSLFWEWREIKTGRVIMCGGFIYHGKHDNGGDGGAPTFSVSLTPQSGWSIHT